DDYRMLMETLGPAPERPSGAPPPGKSSPESRGWVGNAWAASPDEETIRDVLRRYAAALSAKDLAALTDLQGTMDAAQRAALERSFGHSKALAVTFSAFDVLVEGDQALATYTREDAFTDVKSGRPVHLRIHISSRLAKDSGTWRVRMP